GTQVALETGTVAFFVARQLSRLGLDAVVVDAHEVRLKAHRPNQKSDGRDALELCEGLRRGIYRSIVHVPRESGDITSARHAFAPSPLRAPAGCAGRCRQGVAARGGSGAFEPKPWERGRLVQGDRGPGATPGAANLRRAASCGVALRPGADRRA